MFCKYWQIDCLNTLKSAKRMEELLGFFMNVLACWIDTFASGRNYSERFKRTY